MTLEPATLDSFIPYTPSPHTATSARSAATLGPIVGGAFTLAYVLIGDSFLATIVGVCTLTYAAIAIAVHHWGPSLRLRWAFLLLTAASLTATVNMVGGATTIHASWLSVYPVLAWLLMERRGLGLHLAIFTFSVIITLSLALLDGPAVVLTNPNYQLEFEVFSFLMFTAAAVSCVAVGMTQSTLDRQRLEELNNQLAEENRIRRLAEAKAIKAAEVQARFLATMSHEIRTPLHGLLGLTELVLTREIDDQARRWVELALTSGTHLSLIVDDILDLSKLEADGLTLEKVALDLGHLLNECVQTFECRAHAKGLEVDIDIQPSVDWNIQGDPTRLRQIVLNLLGNAVKFTQSGGVTLSAQKSSDTVVIEVIDTGVGIPADVLPRLFQPFEQASVSTTRRHGGTGLGLSIVGRLVAKMGGTISLKSNEGGGTTASVRLPLPPSRTRSIPTAVPPPAPHTLRGRVLVVDDEPLNLIVAEAALEQFGIDVHTAKTGEEAIQKVLKDTFDLVLMDGHMPDMDGYQAAKIIRNRAGAEAPPIAAFTASTAETDRARASEAGMVGRLSKPISPDALKTLLRRWLPFEASGRPSLEAVSEVRR